MDGEESVWVGGSTREHQGAGGVVLIHHFQAPEQSTSSGLKLVVAVYLRHHRRTRIRTTRNKTRNDQHLLIFGTFIIHHLN